MNLSSVSEGLEESSEPVRSKDLAKTENETKLSFFPFVNRSQGQRTLTLTGSLEEEPSVEDSLVLDTSDGELLLSVVCEKPRKRVEWVSSC